MSTNSLDLAWLAGIIDGEGTVGIARTNNKTQAHPYLRPHLQIANTDMRIIGKAVEVLRSVTGKAPSVVVSNKGGNGCKRGYRVAVHTQWELLLILPAVSPYLVAKREQAELVIEFCKRRCARIDSYRWYEFKQQDEATYSRCTALNRRGEAPSEPVVQLAARRA